MILLHPSELCLQVYLRLYLTQCQAILLELFQGLYSLILLRLLLYVLYVLVEVLLGLEGQDLLARFRVQHYLWLDVHAFDRHQHLLTVLGDDLLELLDRLLLLLFFLDFLLFRLLSVLLSILQDHVGDFDIPCARHVIWVLCLLAQRLQLLQVLLSIRALNVGILQIGIRLSFDYLHILICLRVKNDFILLLIGVGVILNLVFIIILINIKLPNFLLE